MKPADRMRASFFACALAAARREGRRIRRRGVYGAILVVLPIVSFLFFVLLFGDGAIVDLPIAVLDEDRTPLSRTVVSMIDATPAARVAFEVPSHLEGERLIREGRIAALVQIPDRFQQQLLGGGQTTLVCSIIGTNLSVNGMLAKDIQTAVVTFSTGIGLRKLVLQGAAERQAMALMQPVRFEKHVLFNPEVNYAWFLAPGFLPMMLLVFVVMTTTYALGSELKEGTAAGWIAAAGGRFGAALAGKLLPVTAAACLQGVAMFLLLVGAIGTPLNGSAGLLALATLLLILAYQAISAMLVALTANLRLSLSLGGGYAVLAFSFSGLTFPLPAMWKPAWWLSFLFPYTYYMQIMIDQLMRGAPAGVSLPAVGALALFVLVPLLTLPRLKLVCTDPQFRGRE